MNIILRRFSLLFPALILLLGLFPVQLTICLLYAPQAVPFLWLQTGLTLGTVAISSVLNGKKRIPAALVGAICHVLISEPLDWQHAPWLLLLPVISICQIFFLINPDIARRAFSLPLFIICAGCYGAVQFSKSTQLGDLLPYDALSPSLEIAFVLFLFCCLLLNNQELLQAEIRFGRNVPAGIRRVNRLNIICLLLLSAIFACIPQITAFLSFLYHEMKVLIQFIVRHLSGLLAGDKPATAPTMGFDPSAFGMGEPVPEAAPNPLFELILNILTDITLASLAAALLYLIGKRLLQLFRFLALRFQQYLGAFDHVYTDTYEDIPESGAVRETVRRTKQTVLRRKAGSPREQIRLLYRLRLRKHPEWSPADTVKAHLTPQAAVLYEVARYSPHPVTEQDADAFAKLIDSTAS